MEIYGGIITSRQNRTVIDTVKLQDRKARDERGLFRFDGVKLMCEAIKRGIKPEYMVVAVSAYERVFERAGELYDLKPENADCPVMRVTDDIFGKISEEKAPDGVICVARYIDKFHKITTIYNDGMFAGVSRDAGILILESVRDPVNVGAIIRSAAALGAGMIIMSRDCADIYNPKTIRASMGTLFSQRIAVCEDLPASIKALREQGRRVFAAALDDSAEKLGDFDTRPGDCAVVGNEGHGLSAEAIGACDRSVLIPMQGKTESLNVSVAAALLMWELGKNTKNIR